MRGLRIATRGQPLLTTTREKPDKARKTHATNSDNTTNNKLCSWATDQGDLPSQH